MLRKKSLAGRVAATCLSIAACLMAPFLAVKAHAEYPYFYGGNAHPDFNWSADTMVAKCHQHGMRYVREDCWDITTAQTVANLAYAVRQRDPAIQFLACLTLNYNASHSEQVNHDDAYNAARPMVQILAGAGITAYECGNELTTKDHNQGGTWWVGAAGDCPNDPVYFMGNGAWNAMRGAMRGMIDAVHNVDNSFRAGIDFCSMQTAASDWLWNGGAPDGTTGHPTVRWDITMWHTYDDIGGSMFSCYGSGWNCHPHPWNMMDYIWNAYHRPIMITEWNANPSGSWNQAHTVFTPTTGEPYRSTYTNNRMQEFYNNRFNDHIEAAFVYIMYGQPDFSIETWPQQVAAYDSFTANHGMGPTTSSPLVGRKVTMQSYANSLFVCADNAGNNPLIANKQTAAITWNSWEEYLVVDQGYGYISLQSLANNQYVSAVNSGASPLIANCASYYAGAGSWEAFKLVDLGNWNFALQASVNGKYVSAENFGNSPLIADKATYSTASNSWEMFYITPH